MALSGLGCVATFLTSVSGPRVRLVQDTIETILAAFGGFLWKSIVTSDLGLGGLPLVHEPPRELPLHGSEPGGVSLPPGAGRAGGAPLSPSPRI